MLARSALSVLTIAAVTCGNRDAAAPLPTAPSSSAVTPWSDEFEGPAGSAPNPRLWTYDLGNNNGWGNNELQTYTSAPANVHLDGAGHLVIRVERSGTGYTSARLKTQRLALAHYGRVEARIRVPEGRGLWPAFWMLGQSFNGSNWPDCGEIDVMEHVGREPLVVHGTVHGPGYSGARGISGSHTMASRVAEDFRVFAADWSPDQIAFSVDGTVYHRVSRSSLPSGAAWVFAQPFFVILNVAVGGTFGGPVGDTTHFPQEMRVDYVRYTPTATP